MFTQIKTFGENAYLEMKDDFILKGYEPGERIISWDKYTLKATVERLYTIKENYQTNLTNYGPLAQERWAQFRGKLFGGNFSGGCAGDFHIVAHSASAVGYEDMKAGEKAKARAEKKNEALLNYNRDEKTMLAKRLEDINTRARDWVKTTNKEARAQDVTFLTYRIKDWIDGQTEGGAQRMKEELKEAREAVKNLEEKLTTLRCDTAFKIFNDDGWVFSEHEGEAFSLPVETVAEVAGILKSKKAFRPDGIFEIVS